MAAASILHDVPRSMIERIERSTSRPPEILAATELEEGGHTVTTVIYRTELGITHSSEPAGAVQVTIRATIFVDGKGQNDLIVSTETKEPPASAEYLQLVAFVEANDVVIARRGRRRGYLTLDRSGQREVPRVRLRDSRRAGGHQYSPVFERHVEAGSKEPLELRCSNGRYAPVVAFFAGGAAERVSAS